jgi:hypothetical protein
MIVYSNSCSFGAPKQGHTVYADKIAEYFNATLINSGIPGSCNRRIIRSSIRDLLTLQHQHADEDILALVGLSFISRTELWQPSLPPTETDGDFHPIAINWSNLDFTNGLIDTIIPDIHKFAHSSVQNYYKQWLDHYSPEAEVTNLITDLISLTGLLKSRNIRYLIFSNVDVLPGAPLIDYTAPFLSSLYSDINNDPNVLDLLNFSFGTYALTKNYIPKDVHLFGKHGHPNEQAHIDFATYLIVQYLNV